jgi:solute:Na+ symporter, SSS family
VLLAGFSAQFGPVDWLVVLAYLVFTSWLGAAMAGKQANIRDFFLGGRKLPWWAVSGSIIASEISALTFVSVPWVVFQPRGNLTYLQLGVFGSLLARVIVGYWLVPAYYRREIYSPFDYMHNALGGHVRGLTTVLFVLKALLAQSSRIYLAAEVLVTVLNDQLVWLARHLGLNELAWAIGIIAVVSIAWTLFGGMRTVIWTDVALFACFTIGALVALGTVIWALPGGAGDLWRAGWNARESGGWGKFTFFDWSTSPTRDFTIWTAVIASTWGGIGSYGLDQTLAQRMFCCRNAREARWAIISSSVSQLVTFTVALVGIGLFAYYQNHPLVGEAQRLFEEKGDRILPIFVVEVVPLGLKGMIIAAIFAAAISTMMGVLTATSQTSLTAFYLPLRRWQLRRQGAPALHGDVEALEAVGPATAEDRRTVLVSRGLVLFWGVALALLSYYTWYVAQEYKSILQLGLAMAGYILGALLAGFLLSFFPLRVDSRGFMFAAPLSCLCVFALIWHQPWTQIVCWSAAVLLLAAWIGLLVREGPGAKRPPLVLAWPAQTLVLLLGIAGMLWLNYHGYWPGPLDKAGHPGYITVAWPWEIPLGSAVAFVWGYLLARRQPDGAPAAAPFNEGKVTI